jgi:protein gp37
LVEKIFWWCKTNRDQTFIFLTKRPENLIKWSPFPDNCHVGVSVTDATMFIDAVNSLRNVTARVKFISFEPLLERINGGECEGSRLDCLKDAGINWVIIGQQTPVSKKNEPKIEWVQEIVEACDKAGVKVWLKDNLNKSIPERDKTFRVRHYLCEGCDETGCDSCGCVWKLRQELP